MCSLLVTMLETCCCWVSPVVEGWSLAPHVLNPSHYRDVPLCSSMSLLILRVCVAGLASIIPPVLDLGSHALHCKV